MEKPVKTCNGFGARRSGARSTAQTGATAGQRERMADMRAASAVNCAVERDEVH